MTTLPKTLPNRAKKVDQPAQVTGVAVAPTAAHGRPANLPCRSASPCKLLVGRAVQDGFFTTLGDLFLEELDDLVAPRQHGADFRLAQNVLEPRP